MKQLKNLTFSQKARIFSFVAIAACLLYLVLANAWSVRVTTPQFNYVDDLTVDGEDFSPIANLLTFGANGVLDFFSMVFSIVAILLVALLLLVPWRYISIRKASVVAEPEWKIAKYTWICFTVLSPIVSLILLRFTNLTYILLIAGFPILLLWLLGVCTLHNTYLQCTADETQS